MSSVISANSPLPQPAAPAQPVVHTAAPKGPAAPAQQAPVPAMPVKAEIKLDTETLRKNLQEAISRINDMMRDGGRGLNFSVDESLGRPVVKVRNLESGEVVRQIPNEVVVRVAHSIDDLKGMLHNAVV